MLLLEISEKSLGDLLNIEGVLEPPRDLGERKVSLHIELADVDDQRGEFAKEEIARLAFDVEVIAAAGFAVLVFHPVPEALRRSAGAAVGEDEKVLGGEFRHGGVDRGTPAGIGDRAFRCRDFEDVDGGEHRHRRAGETLARRGGAVGGFKGVGRVIPAEFVDEELPKLEALEELPGAGEIEGHGAIRRDGGRGSR